MKDPVLAAYEAYALERAKFDLVLTDEVMKQVRAAHPDVNWSYSNRLISEQCHWEPHPEGVLSWWTYERFKETRGSQRYTPTYNSRGVAIVIPYDVVRKGSAALIEWAKELDRTKDLRAAEQELASQQKRVEGLRQQLASK